jgi:hypothetical protein
MPFGDMPRKNASLFVDQVEVPGWELRFEIVVGFNLRGKINRDRTNCCVIHRKTNLFKDVASPPAAGQPLLPT